MNDLLDDRDDADTREPGIVRGVSVGIVTANKDPDGLGRVKVRFPWRARPDESHWARIAVLMAGTERGTWFLPEVDDEVLVAFDAERVEHLYVVGSLWNGKDRPPERNADGKNDIRMIRSRSGHEIVFDDSENGRIDIHLNENRRRVRLDPNRIEIADSSGNSITVTSDPGVIKISSETAISLESGNIDIKATGRMTIRSSGTLTIQGSTVQIN
jgi:uncharacterized protein involved in type VI secretion and phage assembly